MSQSILITGVYKNNKTYSRGTHNPKNNRNFNFDELLFLHNGIEELKSKSNKFKEIRIHATREGKTVLHQKTNNIDMININMILNEVRQVNDIRF